MFFRLNTKRTVLSCLAAAGLSVISVVLALTLSIREAIPGSVLHLDPRVEGVLEDGRIAGLLHFSDPRVSPLFTGLELTLKKRNSNSIDARYRWGERTSEEINLKGPTLLTPPVEHGYSTLGGLDLSLQPSVSRQPTFVRSLHVRSSFAFAVPSLKFGLLTSGALLMLVLFAALCSYDPSLRGVMIAPIVSTYLLSTALLLISPTPDWAYLIWFFILGGLLLAGYGIRHLLQLRASAPPYQPPSGLRLRDQPWLLGSLLAVAAGAALIRLTGVAFGLPQFYIPDEEWVATRAAQMIYERTVLPGTYGIASGVVYLACLLSLALDPLLGGVSDPVSIAIVGRCFVAALGVLSVLLVFGIGRILFGIEAGLLAAAMLAVAPLHVICSRYLLHGVPFVFLVLLTTLFSVQALSRKSWRAFLLAAISAGISLSFSWQAAALIPVVFAGPFIAFAAAQPERFTGNSSAFRDYLLTWNPRRHIIPMFRRAIPGLGLFVLSSFVSMPFVFADFAGFRAATAAKLKLWVSDASLIFSPASDFLMQHFRESLWTSLSIPPAVLALLGCGWLLARRRLPDIILLYLLAASYLAAELSLPRDALFPEQAFLICVPFLSLAFGAGGSALYRWFLSLPSKRWVIPKRGSSTTIEALPSSWRVHFVVLVAALVLAQAAFDDLRLAAGITADTRELAADWMKQNVTAQSKIVIDSGKYGPKLDELGLISVDAASSNILLSTQSVLRSDADYLVISSLYGRYLAKHGSMKQRYLYERLRNSLEPTAVFEDRRQQYGFHQPIIRIYNLEQIRDESQRSY